MLACDNGTWEHQWEARDLYCEDCGDHSGFACIVCFEQVDSIYESELYERIGQLLSE